MRKILRPTGLLLILALVGVSGQAQTKKRWGTYQEVLQKMTQSAAAARNGQKDLSLSVQAQAGIKMESLKQALTQCVTTKQERAALALNDFHAKIRDAVRASQRSKQAKGGFINSVKKFFGKNEETKPLPPLQVKGGLIHDDCNDVRVFSQDLLALIPTSEQMTPELVTSSLEWVIWSFIGRYYSTLPPVGMELFSGKNLNDALFKIGDDGRLDFPLQRFLSALNNKEALAAWRANTDFYQHHLLLPGQHLDIMQTNLQMVAIDIVDKLYTTDRRQAALFFYNLLLPAAFQQYGLVASSFSVDPPKAFLQLKAGSNGSLCIQGAEGCPEDAPLLRAYLEETLKDEFSLKYYGFVEFDWTRGQLVRLNPPNLERVFEMMLNPLDPSVACAPIERMFNKGNCPDQCGETGGVTPKLDLRQMDQASIGRFNPSSIPDLRSGGGGEAPTEDDRTAGDLTGLTKLSSPSCQGNTEASGGGAMPFGTCYGPPLSLGAKYSGTREEQRLFECTVTSVAAGVPISVYERSLSSPFCGIDFASDPKEDGDESKKPAADISAKEPKDPGGKDSSGKQESYLSSASEREARLRQVRGAVREDIRTLGSIVNRANVDDAILRAVHGYLTNPGDMRLPIPLSRRSLGEINAQMGRTIAAIQSDPDSIVVRSDGGATGIATDHNGKPALWLSQSDAADPIARRAHMAAFVALMTVRTAAREADYSPNVIASDRFRDSVRSTYIINEMEARLRRGRMCAPDSDNCSSTNGCFADIIVLRTAQCVDQGGGKELPNACACTGGVCAFCPENGNDANDASFLFQCAPQMAGADLLNRLCPTVNCPGSSVAIDSTGLAATNPQTIAACCNTAAGPTAAERSIQEAMCRSNPDRCPPGTSGGSTGGPTLDDRGPR